MASWAYNRMNRYSFDNLINNYVKPWWDNYTGYTQMKNTQESLKAQIGYEQYIRQANERALRDWNRNVGSKGRIIRYPEFSYAGQIARSNTSIATAGFSYDNAYANYTGGLLNKSMGLYGVSGRLYRSM